MVIHAFRTAGPFYDVKVIEQFLNTFTANPQEALEFEFPSFRYDLTKTELLHWQVIDTTFPKTQLRCMQVLLEFTLFEREGQQGG